MNAAYLSNIITILIRGWTGLGMSVTYKYATLYHMLWSRPSLPPSLSLSFPPFLPPNLHTCRRPKDLLCLGLFLVFIILWAAIGIYGRYRTLRWMATILGYRRGIPYCYCPLSHVCIRWLWCLVCCASVAQSQLWAVYQARYIVAMFGMITTQPCPWWSSSHKGYVLEKHTYMSVHWLWWEAGCMLVMCALHPGLPELPSP